MKHHLSEEIIMTRIHSIFRTHHALNRTCVVTVLLMALALVGINARPTLVTARTTSDHSAVADTATVCDCLTAFINKCEAQSGKKLTVEQTNQLINSANQIRTELGCL